MRSMLGSWIPAFPWRRSGLAPSDERRQMRDFFSNVSEACFRTCVKSFSSESLTASESKCVRGCTLKILALATDIEAAISGAQTQASASRR